MHENKQPIIKTFCQWTTVKSFSIDQLIMKRSKPGDQIVTLQVKTSENCRDNENKI